MTENKKRVYPAQTIAPPELKPARKTLNRGATLDEQADLRRLEAPQELPKQDLIIRLIDYIKSI